MLLSLSQIALALSTTATLTFARPALDTDSLSKRNNDGSSHSSGPTVTIKNGTVEGVAIESYNQEGSFFSVSRFLLFTVDSLEADA